MTGKNLPTWETTIEKFTLPKDAKLTWGIKGLFLQSVRACTHKTVFVNMTDWDKGPSNMPPVTPAPKS